MYVRMQPEISRVLVTSHVTAVNWTRALLNAYAPGAPKERQYLILRRLRHLRELESELRDMTSGKDCILQVWRTRFPWIHGVAWVDACVRNWGAFVRARRGLVWRCQVRQETL